MKMIENITSSILPKIPKSLSSILEVVSTFPLHEREAFLLLDALESVEKQFLKDKLEDMKIARTTIIITSDGDVLLSIPKGSFGHYMNQIIIYPVERWRNEKANNLQILTCYIEELCHCIWYLYDEKDVKYKVWEIVQNIKVLENISIDDIYNKDTFIN